MNDAARNRDVFLAMITDVLTACEIAYMLTGSLASSIHGEPRATNDVDLVVEITPNNLSRLLATLPEDCYVSEAAARDALRRLSMFNVIDGTSGWKADFILRDDRAYSRAAFSRRRIAEVLGGSYWVSSPEDVILSKLEWAKKNQSERQITDALSVLRIQKEQVDLDYLREWAGGLGVTDSLRQIFAKIGIG